VYSNLAKNGKIKSPSSMRNERFHPSKCRGKVQKMGVLYTHSSKMPGPSPNFFIKPKIKIKKIIKTRKRRGDKDQPVV
jgi:hypothetical protein